MKEVIDENLSKFQVLTQKIKSRIISFENNRRLVNYNLIFNILVVSAFGLLMINVNYDGVKRYVNIQQSLNKLNDVAKEYDSFLSKSKTSLRVDNDKIELISKNFDKEIDLLNENLKYVEDEVYKEYFNDFISILQKRFTVKDEIIKKYNALYDTYKDYRKTSLNAEHVLSNNMDIQVKIKHIMLELENIRILEQGKNRDYLLQDIRDLRADLIDRNPEIQARVGLFSEQSEKIISLLRYIDTIQSSMKSDDLPKKLKYLQEETSSLASTGNLLFRLKLFSLFILGIVIVSLKLIMLTWFFHNRRKTDKIKKQAAETVAKSKMAVARSKQYVIEAQGGQYKLLKSFCNDFYQIIKNVSHLTRSVQEDAEKESSLSEGETNKEYGLQFHIKTLSSSVTSLEDWLNNYLNIHIAREYWRDPEYDVLDIEKVIDDIFIQSRFYAGEREHEMSILHKNVPKNILADSEYIRDIFMNMVYLSLKWSDNKWIKTSIDINKITDTQEDASEDNNEENENIKYTHIMELSVIDTSPQEEFEYRASIFNKQEEDENNKTNDIDRFISTALYFIRQISDIIKADISYERSIAEENILKIKIPVQVNDSDNNQEISTPILQNKTAIIVSPHNNILYSLEEQLKIFGMNTVSLSDRYAAIGHIVGAKQTGEEFDIIIVDHRPPEIDAAVLAKVVRENSKIGMVHIVAITTESFVPSLSENGSDIDEIITKPAKPTELKSLLNHFIEIQLYGESDTAEDYDYDNTEDSKRFLSIMNEDLSSNLIKLIVTRENYHIDIATTKQQVMELLDHSIYDFIVISNNGTWIIPEDIIKNIRRHHTENQNSVVILIHDEVKETYKDKLNQLGFDDFIPVPLSKKTFLDKIEQWDKASQDYEEDSEVSPENEETQDIPQDESVKDENIDPDGETPPQEDTDNNAA